MLPDDVWKRIASLVAADAPVRDVLPMRSVSKQLRGATSAVFWPHALGRLSLRGDTELMEAAMARCEADRGWLAPPVDLAPVVEHMWQGIAEQRVRTGEPPEGTASVVAVLGRSVEAHAFWECSNLQRLFFLASSTGATSTVKQLLANGRVGSDNDSFAIVFASQRGHVDIVRALVDHPGFDPAVIGNGPLRAAALTNHAEIVRVLLCTGSVDVRDQQHAALRGAARQGHIAVLDVVFELDPAAIEEVKALLLDDGIRTDPAVVAWVLDHCTVDTQLGPLVAAAEQTLPDATKLLLDAGFDATELDSLALRRAVERDNVAVARLLLEAGANARAEDSASLRVACRIGNEAMVRLLLTYGAAADSDDNAPLRAAVFAGHTGIIDILCALPDGAGVDRRIAG